MKAKNLSLMLILLWVSLPSFAGQANLTWTNTARYTDIEPGPGTRQSTLEGVQRAFANAFTDAAKQLPEGYAFAADIGNVDLAGQVNPPQLMSPTYITTRVLSNNYFPAITLSYTLTDANGKVVLNENDFILKDLDYLSSSTVASASTPYYYEVRMIRDWFEKAILPAVN